MQLERLAPALAPADFRNPAPVEIADLAYDTRAVGPGTLFFFEPDERRTVSSERGARILLLLAPWPGAGHYRGGGDSRLERAAG